MYMVGELLPRLSYIICCFVILQSGLIYVKGGNYSGLEMLVDTILPGVSMIGKTTKDLLDGSDEVRIAGVVENFSRWSMFYSDCVFEDGQANVLMQTVKPGYKEGFAAHKKVGVYGVHMKCTFVMDNEKIHFMVDVPWDVGITKENRLALAVCNGTADDTCNSLTLSDMGTGSYSFMTSRMYKNSVQNLAQCNSKVCLVGTMGTTFTPIIRIKAYPVDVKDLSTAAAEKLKKTVQDKKDSEKLEKKEYENGLKNILKYADKSSSRMLKVSTGFTFLSFVIVAVVTTMI